MKYLSTADIGINEVAIYCWYWYWWSSWYWSYWSSHLVKFDLKLLSQFSCWYWHWWCFMATYCWYLYWFLYWWTCVYYWYFYWWRTSCYEVNETVMFLKFSHLFVNTHDKRHQTYCTWATLENFNSLLRNCHTTYWITNPYTSLHLRDIKIPKMPLFK